MTMVNDRIYVFGGFQEGGVLNDLLSIDILTWQWISVKTQGPTPPPRRGIASTRVGNKIYFTGGCDYRQEICYTDTYILDTESLWWTKVDNTNSKTNIAPRGDFSMMFFRSNIFAFGGCEMYKKCYNNVVVMNVNDLCPNKCSNNGECKNIVGCVCNSGWIYHDCSFRTKCQDDCNNHGQCKNTGKCSCYPGYSGLTCGGFIDCPLNCTDSSNGLCQNNGQCKCNEGYTGLDCANYSGPINKTHTDPIAELTSVRSELRQEQQVTNQTNTTSCINNCTNNGECDTANGKCICKNGFYGDYCQNTKIIASEANITLTANFTNTTNTTIETTLIPSRVNSIITIEATPETCSYNCTNGGICRNNTCFCSQGFTSEDCALTYKQFIEKGFIFAPWIKYIASAFGVASITTLILLIIGYKAKEKAGDHFAFE
jgi:hypothetical protein